MTTESLNRRQFLRFPTDILVWWTKDWEPEPISVLDISAGGMLFEYHECLPSGTDVSLHIEFPGHDGLVLCHCKVAHSRPGEAAFWRVGLQIEQVEGMDQERFTTRLKNGLNL